jgi:multiple sugar transport system substrate-binding protein
VQTVVQPAGYAMSPYTENQKAAWKLLSWLTGPKGQKVMAEKGQAIPANKMSVDAFKKQGKDNSFDNQVFFDAASKAIPNPYFEGKQKLWWEYLPQKLELPLNGKGSIQKAVQEIANLWDPMAK